MPSSFKEHILLISWSVAKRPHSTEGKSGIHETLENRFLSMNAYNIEAFFLLLSSFSQHGWCWETTPSWWFLGCHFCNSSYADEALFVAIFSVTNQEMDERVPFFWTLMFLGKHMHQDSSPHSPLNKNRHLFSSKSMRLQYYSLKRQNVFSTNKDLDPQPHSRYFIRLIRQSNTGPPNLIFFRQNVYPIITIR